MRISKWVGSVLFVMITMTIMSLVMSLTLTILNRGLGDGFLHSWMRSWAMGVVVATPTAFVALGISRRIVDWLSR